MRRLLFGSLIVSLLTLAYWQLPAGQVPPTAALFGPEVFVRAMGKPIVETWHLSTTCFEGPFTLHVRNGDPEGRYRVSSAEVWLDGVRLLGPSDFSQQVPGYDIPVTVLSESILEVKLDSVPGNSLEIWIEGTRENLFEPESVTVLPSGGKYRLSNGMKLEIPEGSVCEPTVLQLRLYPKEEIEPILNAPDHHPRDLMSAFSMKPPGFAFQRPISITLPYEPRPDPRSLPFVFDLNLQTGELRPGLVYGGAPLPIDMPTAGPTAKAPAGPVAAFSAIQSAPEGPWTKVDCDKREFQIVNLTDFPGDMWIKIQAWIDNVFLASDCMNNTCRCCLFTVRTEDADTLSDECHSLRANGTITYEDCRGGQGATESWSFEDSTVHDITYNLPTGSLMVGQPWELEVKALDINHNELKIPIHVSSQGGFIDVERLSDYAYRLNPMKAGCQHFVIDVGCGTDPEDFFICVESGVKTFKIVPDKPTIFVHEKIYLEAVILDANDNRIYPPIEWHVPATEALSFDEVDRMVTGLALGTATITATAEGITAVSEITVVDGYVLTWSARAGDGADCSWERPAGLPNTYHDTYTCDLSFTGSARIIFRPGSSNGEILSLVSSGDLEVNFNRDITQECLYVPPVQNYLTSESSMQQTAEGMNKLMQGLSIVRESGSFFIAGLHPYEGHYHQYQVNSNESCYEPYHNAPNTHTADTIETWSYPTFFGTIPAVDQTGEKFYRYGENVTPIIIGGPEPYCPTRVIIAKWDISIERFRLGN